MPIDVNNDVKGQVITDVQVVPGPVVTPAASQNEIVVVLGNGCSLHVRAYKINNDPVLKATLQKNVQHEDEQDIP